MKEFSSQKNWSPCRFSPYFWAAPPSQMLHLWPENIIHTWMYIYWTRFGRRNNRPNNSCIDCRNGLEAWEEIGAVPGSNPQNWPPTDGYNLQKSLRAISALLYNSIIIVLNENGFAPRFPHMDNWRMTDLCSLVDSCTGRSLTHSLNWNKERTMYINMRSTKK